MLRKVISVIALSVLVILSFSIKTYAEAPIQEIKQKEPEPKSTWTREEVRDLAIYYANKYSIPVNHMLLTIDQESMFVYNAIGDNGKSLGACQIHESNKIPNEKRNDPIFCLDWTAKLISQGKGRLWTGYRICVLNEVVYHQGARLLCNANGTIR